MSLRKILSMAIVVCLLATQMAIVVFAEEIHADVIETVEETAELEETIVNNGRGIEWSNGQDIAPHELYELSTLRG